MQWTVNNRTDPRACSRLGAGRTDFELLVYQDNREVTRRYARCEDFTLTVNLPAGDYTAYATLVNRNNDPLTSTLPLEDLEIVRRAALNVDVDFPAGSFL